MHVGITADNKHAGIAMCYSVVVVYRLALSLGIMHVFCKSSYECICIHVVNNSLSHVFKAWHSISTGTFRVVTAGKKIKKYM